MTERVIAFSVPSEQHFLVMGYDGLYELSVTGTSVEVEKHPEHGEDYSIYETANNTFTFLGKTIPALGLHGGTGIQKCEDGEWIEWNQIEDGLFVFRGDESLFAIRPQFRDEDWVQVSYSIERDLIILACPNQFYVLKRKAAAT